MRIPNALMPHKVTVQPLNGSTPTGAVFGDPVTVRAYVEDKTELVTTGQSQEVISSATVFLDPENYVGDGSKVTIWLGTPRQRTAKVLTSQFLDNKFLSNVQLLLE